MEPFDELAGCEAGRAGELAAEALRRERAEPEKGRDERPLDERAASARGAAEALKAQRATTKSLERGARPREAWARGARRAPVATALPRDEAIVLISGADPLKDKKYDITKHPRWPEVYPGHRGARFDRPFDYSEYMERRKQRC